MKKNRLMKVAALLLALTLMTSCFVGGTFAKYTSKATAGAQATVATWDIKLNEGAMSAYTSFNLFDTVVRDVPDDNETDVLAGKIAPGTQGSFSFKLENDSQVNATYTFKLTCTDATIPFTFTVGGNTYNYTQISTTGVTGELVMDAAATTITVDWVWPFEGTDDVDLELAGDTLNFTLTIDVTQVN